MFCRGAHVCEDTRIPFLVACRNGLCWLPDVSGGKLQGFCSKRAQRALYVAKESRHYLHRRQRPK